MERDRIRPLRLCLEAFGVVAAKYEVYQMDDRGAVMTYRPSIAERIAWSSGQLGSAGVKVLVALWSCGDYETGRHCRPYLSTLVARSGISLATVKRCLRGLKDRTQPGGPWIVASSRHRHATSYDLCLDRLATRPPKEQQMSIGVTIATDGSEAQNEPLILFEAQNEPLGTKSEAQNEPPTSDPDLDLEVRTHTPRARGDHGSEAQNELQNSHALPLLGRPSVPRCAHPYRHAWCGGRVHVPKDLHFEFLDKLDTRPGESRAQKAGRLIAFYAATMAAIPATQAIADDGYTFWKAAFKAWASSKAELVGVAPEPVTPRYDAVWQQILRCIETKVDRHTFHTWFLPLVQVTGGPTLIEVTKRGPESGLFADWIHKHHRAVVQAAVEEVRPGARLEVIDVWAIQRAGYA